MTSEGDLRHFKAVKNLEKRQDFERRILRDKAAFREHRRSVACCAVACFFAALPPRCAERLCLSETRKDEISAARLCLASNDHESMTQTFSVAINGTNFPLTTVVTINRGNFSGTA